MKRTPLYGSHLQLGAKLIDFGGWEMPVQYTSITEEHLNVRKAAGIFDISHMGEVRVSGADAATFLNQTLTNDIRKIAPGQAQYTLTCNASGGVIDDLYAYRLAKEDYLLIINASRIEADLGWLERQLIKSGSSDLVLSDVSDATAAVAVQGPKVVEFIGEIFSGAPEQGAAVDSVTDLQKNQIGEWDFVGQKVWVARTGYTGEDGFEIVAPSTIIARLWDQLLKVGGSHGLKPAGLGARDTLRTEVCYPLYGHELDEQTSPIEAGLGFFVALDKDDDFAGKSVLAAQKQNGTGKKLVAFKMNERSAPPRPGYPIWSAENVSGPIGQVVSGTQSPSLGFGLGLGYVPPNFSKPQTPLQIEIRGKRSPATVVPKPIYKKPH
jgi:glycine cleavage system T protein (aminomethyltransferase)